MPGHNSFGGICTRLGALKDSWSAHEVHLSGIVLRMNEGQRN